MASLLEVENIEKSFGGLKALDGIDLSVEENSITSVIGPNGSGKTTLLNCINGIYVPEKGHVTYRGRSILGKKPHEVARMGIGRTFQVARVFKKIPVVDNILAPVLSSHRPMTDLRREAVELLKRVGMEKFTDGIGGDLSGGQQKLLELLRAWIADFDLILLDEPFAGVHPELKALFFEEIRELQRLGKTFVLISHDMHSVYTLSDTIVVFDLGKVIARGQQEEIQNNERVIEAYLGN
ncbi:MAG: ABC transporter ATP-binding protein [Desulfobacteraceae bacterium]|nr:ABC transporter ATP-binding protein [Desulfobacteraceae bacterium]MBC2751919.1 ABC transporter ATP-binding protein [Desulfobacteraceae bacterium]